MTDPLRNKVEAVVYGRPRGGELRARLARRHSPRRRRGLPGTAGLVARRGVPRAGGGDEEVHRDRLPGCACVFPSIKGFVSSGHAVIFHVGVGQPKVASRSRAPRCYDESERVPEDLCLVAPRHARTPRHIRIEGGSAASLAHARACQGDEAKTQGDGKQESLSHGRSLFFWARDGSG